MMMSCCAKESSHLVPVRCWGESVSPAASIAFSKGYDGNTISILLSLLRMRNVVSWCVEANKGNINRNCNHRLNKIVVEAPEFETGGGWYLYQIIIIEVSRSSQQHFKVSSSVIFGTRIVILLPALLNSFRTCIFYQKCRRPSKVSGKRFSPLLLESTRVPYRRRTSHPLAANASKQPPPFCS
jgi:hypothetical protein